MSQDGLGKIIGADVQAIARWEKSGKIPKMADKLIRISYLGNSSLSHVIKTLNKIISVRLKTMQNQLLSIVLIIFILSTRLKGA